MTCTHDKITSWRLEDGSKVPLWSCAQCRVKFEPIQMERKPWVSLTDAEFQTCLKAGGERGWIGVANAIEAKLKERNQ